MDSRYHWTVPVSGKSCHVSSFLQDLIDMTVRKMDLDKDGRICYDDFEETVS